MGLFRGEFYSQKLRMTTQLYVIFPDPSNDVTPLWTGEPRVLYLLHGLAANASEWTRFSKIEYYAKKYNFIVIMPEVQRSFYCTARYGPDYFGYVADELSELCKTWFRLPEARASTFIAGESMGGYGAVKVALRRPERFAACASLSGVMDYAAMVERVRKGEWPDVLSQELDALHGTGMPPDPQEDLFQLLRDRANDPGRPGLLQICGTGDFLYADNLRFRDAARAAGYGHTYLEWAGEHAWSFWDVAISGRSSIFAEWTCRPARFSEPALGGKTA